MRAIATRQKELWHHSLPNGAEGMPATNQVNGRPFVGLLVAQVNATFPAVVNSAGRRASRRAAPGGPPEAGAAPGCHPVAVVVKVAAAADRYLRARYIAFAVPQ